MQPSNVDQNSRFHNRAWYLLTEYPLSEFLSDHGKGVERMAILLFQKMGELGLSSENLESIDQMLAGFVKEALTQCKTGSQDLPGRIRVFCQQKVVNAISSAHKTDLVAAKPAQKIHPSGTKIDGGWGCFLIKGGGNDTEDTSTISKFCIDLYLYKEG